MNVLSMGIFTNGWFMENDPFDGFNGWYIINIYFMGKIQSKMDEN